MGRRRRVTPDGDQVARHRANGLPPQPSAFVRWGRHELTLAGGFLVAALTTIACGGASTRPVSADIAELRIGQPEGLPIGDSGPAEIARMISADGLTQLTPDGRVVGRLAERWNWERNGLRLRVTLPSDVLFHDGTKLTPAVVADILRTAAQDSGNRSLYNSFNYITSVAVAGDHDIVIDVSSPASTLPEDLELPLLHGTAGTGPFRVVGREGNDVVLKSFEHYRGGAPSIARVVITPFANLRVAWTSLLRGDVDMVTEVPSDAVEFVRNDDVQLISFARRYQYVVAFNQRHPALRRPVVRQALNLAINRQLLVQRVLKGRGTASTGPLWPQYWAYDAEMPTYGFDPARAESLLDAAGLPRGAAADGRSGPPARFRFTCLIPENFIVWERMALEVQKALYGIGVDMQVKAVPFPEWYRLILAGDFDASLNDMISGPTPFRAYIFWRSASAAPGLNVYGYENATAERLFETLRLTTNEGVVRSTTRRLQRVFFEDPPALFLAWNERIRAVRGSVEIPDEPGRDPILTLARWAPRRTQLAAR